MHKAQRSRHNFCVCSFLVSFGRRECSAERPDLLRQQQKKCRQRRRNSTQGVLPRMGPNFPKGKFSKDLILFVRSRHCGELNRGLQNLDSFFEKGFNFVSAKLWFCALIRGLQNLELPARERFYSFRLYEKNGEYPRGLRTSGLRGRFKSPLDTRFSLK